jgi:hypothetical protein
MGNRSWLHPLTGLLFIVLVFASFIVMGEEPPDATEEPLQDVVDYYVDNEDSIWISSILGGLAGAMFIFYGAYLYKRLRASGADGTAIATFGGIVAFAVGVALDSTISITLTELVNGDEAEAPGAVQALSVFWQNDFLPFAMGLFVFLWGFGLAILRHGVLPKWMGWIVLVGAITAISPAFFVGLIIAALAVLVSSIMFMREERSGGSASAAPAA